MGTLFRSDVAVIARVAALVLVGSLAGCLDDGWYYASGEPPASAPSAGTSPGCKNQVASPSTGGDVDPHAPHASPSARAATPGRALREPSTAIEPAVFKPANCERNATD
jgi:hypothetical protein